MKRLLRSPLLHIAALGMLLALGLRLAAGPVDDDQDRQRIEIGASDLEQLRVSWVRTWQREPTPLELRSQLEQLIRQEILYREALARGYDRDDTVVRRAMQRKMEFIAEAQAEARQPNEQEALAYFALRPERYRLPPRVSFAHVYVNTGQRGAEAERHALELLEELRRVQPEAEQLFEYGDRFLLRHSYSELSQQQLASEFGERFAAALMQLEPGRWQGPIESGYGLHLVRVGQRSEAKLPAWETVRERVLTDMAFENKQAAQEQFFQELAQRYQVLLSPQASRLLEQPSK